MRNMRHFRHFVRQEEKKVAKTLNSGRFMSSTRQERNKSLAVFVSAIGGSD